MNRYRLLGLLAILFLFDQVTKYLFYDMRWGESFSLLEPTFNAGISFGILVPSWMVILISMVILFLLIWSYTKKYLTSIVFLLFVSGLLGNFYDRIFLEGVRDFIVFGDFFVFNIADSYLTLAVIRLILEETGYVKKLSAIFSGK